jgi:hypothetical protein
MIKLSLLLLLVCAWLPLAVAYEDPYDKYRYNREEGFDYDETLDKPWKESGAVIPPLPDPDDMQEVPIDGMGGDFTVFVHTRGLALGEDRVLRYWLLLRSRLGAVNTLYEGLRCTTHEYKTYAYGSKREKQGYRVNKAPKWMTVAAVRGKGFRHELDELFCNYGIPFSPEEIIRRIRDASVGRGVGSSSGPAAFF